MPKKKAPVPLEKLDKNFRPQTGGRELCWIDAFDPRLSLRGLGWLEENREKKSFRRLPDRAEPFLSEGVRALSWCPASAFLSFFTNATALSVRLAYPKAAGMAHMPDSGSSGAELYLREGTRWLPLASAIPAAGEREFERQLIDGLPAGAAPREYRLYLPLYNPLERLAIGVPPGAEVAPSPAPQDPHGAGPIFFYGTSITQGGCASTAGGDFVSTLGRELGAEIINFGFSGNGKGEPEMARLIREIDAGMFVLDYSANCDAARLRDTLPPFVRILREKRPRTPIVILSQIGYSRLLWSREAREELGRRRDVMMRFYLNAKEAGDANLHFIDGWGVLPPGLNGSFVDGAHPTSAGFATMAERLLPLLNLVRLSRE